MNIFAPVSIGEVFDKLSILHLKLIYITDLDKRKAVSNEIAGLEHSLGTDLTKAYPSDPDYCNLFKINGIIWEDIELSNTWNYQRAETETERKAREKVYSSLNLNNNLRFKSKQRINERFNSSIKEVKSHL